MDRHGKEGSEVVKGVHIADTVSQKYRGMDVDQPKLSPMRRKDKARNGDTQPKYQRDHKKIQYRLKYDWQGE